MSDDSAREQLKQKELEFPTQRDEQLRRLRKSQLGDTLSKFLLFVLDCHIGKGVKWRMKVAELAAEMNVHRSTVYDKIGMLEEMSLLIAEECDAARYEFQIVWSNLLEFVPDKSTKATTKSAKKSRRRRRSEHKKVSPTAKELSSTTNEVSPTAKELSSTTNHTTYERKESAHESAPPSPPKGGDGETRMRFLADNFPIPVKLDTPAFRAAWLEWCEYRRSTRRKPITEAAAQKQMAELIRAGPAAAVDAINRAIANDWQGLFPTPSKNKGAHDDDCPQQRKADWAETEWQRAFGESGSDR